MDEIREFLVLEEEEGDRLDVYLSSQLGDMSRSYIQKIIKDKKVTVNNKIEKSKYLVKEEDKIIVTILPGLTDVQFLSTYAYLDVYLVEGGYKSKYLGEVTYDQDGKVAIITIRASDLQQISELNYTKCVLQLNTIDVKGVGYSFETEIDLTEMASYTK